MLLRMLRELVSRGPAAAGPTRVPPAADTDPAQIRAWHNEAFTALQDNDPGSAAALCQRILATEPDHADALHLLSMAQEAAGDKHAALSSLERAIEVAPENVELCAAAGNLCRELGRLEAAAAHLEAAVAADQKHALSHFYLGKLLEASARPGEAAQCFRNAVRLAEAARQSSVALEAAKALAAIDPGALDARVHLGRALNAAGFPDAALESLQEGLERHPGEPRLLETCGMVCLDLGRWAQAMEHLSPVIQAEPGNAFARYAAGVAHKGLGDFGAAVDAFTTAIRIAPDFKEAHFNRGLARFESGNLDSALEDIRWSVFMRTGAPWNENAVQRLDEAVPASSPAFSPVVSRCKLRHDAEQIRYLVSQGRLDRRFLEVAEDYEALCMEIPPDTRARPVSPVPASAPAGFLKTYGRTLYLPRSSAGEKPLINPDLDLADVERRYRSTRPEVVVIDGLLTAEALDALLGFCREATVWNAIKSGYLGAYMHEGFCSELLLRLAAEMRQSLPNILGGLQLQTLWGYKYDDQREGIAVHADQAVVNINFWITPDEANLAPDRGGLVVYRHEPPAEWGASRYNQSTADINRFLESAPEDSVVTVPYRQNRAVMFNSKLFHKTDDFHFRDGYLDRRLNITLLFGDEHANTNSRASEAA